MSEPVSVPALPVYPTQAELPEFSQTSTPIVVVTDYEGSGIAHLAINDGLGWQYKSIPELLSATGGTFNEYTLLANLGSSAALPAKTVISELRRIQSVKFPFYETDFLSRSQGHLYPWGYAAINSGGLAQPTVSTAQRPGIIRVTCSATLNSGVRWVTDTKSQRIAGGELFVCSYYANNLATITTRLGFLDTADQNDATNGCYFEIAPSGIAVGKNAAASVRNATGTIHTLTTGNWYTFIILVNNNATSVQFTILDGAGAVLGTAAQTATIPTAADTGNGFVTTSTNGAAITLLEIDYMAMGWTKALARF